MDCHVASFWSVSRERESARGALLLRTPGGGGCRLVPLASAQLIRSGALGLTAESPGPAAGSTSLPGCYRAAWLANQRCRDGDIAQSRDRIKLPVEERGQGGRPGPTCGSMHVVQHCRQTALSNPTTWSHLVTKATVLSRNTNNVSLVLQPFTTVKGVERLRRLLATVRRAPLIRPTCSPRMYIRRALGALTACCRAL